MLSSSGELWMYFIPSGALISLAALMLSAVHIQLLFLPNGIVSRRRWDQSPYGQVCIDRAQPKLPPLILYPSLRWFPLQPEIRYGRPGRRRTRPRGVQV